MLKDLERILREAVEKIHSVQNEKERRQVEIALLGRKGKLTALLKQVKDAPKDKLAEFGKAANHLKNDVTRLLEEKKQKLLLSSQQGTEDFDLSLPGVRPELGHRHLVTQAIKEIVEIFESIGFYRVRYPEVEWDWYAFESLNMPKDHPARDEWETFFIADESGKVAVGPEKFGKMILTPHTSSGQVREMEIQRPPIRMMNISKCFRRQIDSSHTPMFHQFEGLLIDRNITIAHLKGTLEYFAKKFFGSDRKIRIRPYHFQFTEPSFETDVSCGICKGKGCKLCKAGWLELGGAGMVHPNVLRAGGIDPGKYSGFAFGWGVERTFLMKAGLNIPDIRLLYQNDLRFLQQF